MTALLVPFPDAIPLAALRIQLDDGARACHWSVDPEGVPGRALVLPAPGRITFPLRLDHSVRLYAPLRLIPRDWRDGTGAVRVEACAVGLDGSERVLGSVTLEVAQRGGRLEGASLSCELPAGSTTLQLRTTKLFEGPQAVARALCIEPELVIAPTGPTDAAAEPPAAGPPIPEEALGPRFSILCPVHDPPTEMLAEAIASVFAQRYPHWELCLTDDGSQDREVIAQLEAAAADPRVHLERLEPAQGISAATNAALGAARGDYIALLDHDDALEPDALELVAAAIGADPGLDMLYSDEAIVRDGVVTEHYLKPGWSPESMCSLMFTCHLGVYRRSLALELGGFRSAFDGAQDHDFTLRIAERTNRIQHLARPIYRWRAHAESTAGGGQAKPYAAVAGRAAVAEHLARRALPATVDYAGPGYYSIRFAINPAEQVSIVLADGGDPGTRWAIAAADAAGEHLLFLPGPAEGVTGGWLERLLGYARLPEIAAAIPTLVAANGQIEDAGVAMPAGVPLPLTHGIDATTVGPVTLNVLAAGSAMLTSRATYQQLGGLDASFKSLALTEFCLRAALEGMRCVSVPETRLRITGPSTSVNDLGAIARLSEVWSQRLGADPYYNPNFRDDRGDFTPRAGLG